MDILDNDPLISIVTVCYNSEKTIAKTIDSILAQSYHNVEYILIDGQSTDETISIIKSYEEGFKKRGILYRWKSEPDDGIYDAMNKGIKMCNGEIIGLINSDDWYEKGIFDKVSDCISYSGANIDVIYGDIFLVGKKKVIKKKPKHLSQIKQDMSLFHPSCFVMRSVYESVGYFDTKYRLAADYDFLLRCYMKEKRFLYLAEPIAYYFLGGHTDVGIYDSWKEVKAIQEKYGMGLLQSNYHYYLKCLKRFVLKFVKP